MSLSHYATSYPKVLLFLSRPAYFLELFHDGDRYHIETSPLICSANQWTGFFMIMASVMKELNMCDIIIYLIGKHKLASSNIDQIWKTAFTAEFLTAANIKWNLTPFRKLEKTYK